MKFFILSLLVAFSAQAHAVTKRTCKTKNKIVGYQEKGQKYTFSFQVTGLTKEKKVAMKPIGWHDDYEMDIYLDIKPNLERNPLFTLNIEPRAQVEKNASGKTVLKITADDIGMNYATLVLYKSGRYKKGYLVTKMYMEDSEYTPVKCKVTR